MMKKITIILIISMISTPFISWGSASAQDPLGPQMGSKSLDFIKPTPFSYSSSDEAPPIPSNKDLVLKTGSSPKAWYKKWWVWTIAGAVIAGTVFAVGSNDKGGGSPPPGSLSIEGPLP